MARLIIDPVSRVGGNLRVEVALADAAVSDAWVSGTMFRGIELILQGRDARDAWLIAQRICGSCGTAHALASVRAVENALGIVVPKNARLLRNILQGVHHVVDEASGFYLRHALDWVDAASSLRGDPAAAAALAGANADREGSTVAAMRTARERLGQLVDPGHLGPFANAYSGHPAYRLSPEASLLVMAHYLEALDWRRRVLTIETLLGGKSPHPQSFLVGGMTIAPEWGGPRRPGAGEHPWQVERNAPTALSPAGLAQVASLIADAVEFVERAYLPDVLMLASQYSESPTVGTGIGNYLAFGEFPGEDGASSLALPRGRVMGRDLSAVVPVDQTGVAETVAHAHYSSGHGDDALVRPAVGETVPVYSGPTPPFRSLEGAEKYSWLKAPRYEDDPVEVGPLARTLVAYASAAGDVRARLDEALRTSRLELGGLQGTLGRTITRALDARIVVRRLQPWLDDLRANLAAGDLAVVDVTMWDPGTWPREAEGWALGETPRGALGHWVRIRDGRIEQYQVVDPTTWNASPRDARDRRGAIEQALLRTPVADPRRPVEILRTVHSFDPCPTCGVH